MRRYTKVGATAVVAIAAVAAAGCSGGSSAKSANAHELAASTPTTTGMGGPTIDVAGHGQVEGKPDLMTVTMGVQTTAASAQTALADNNARAAALISAFEAHGVKEEDLTTVDLEVSPTFDKNFHVTGYSASNTVNAKLRDLAKAGSVIDSAAVAAGPDVRLNGVTFSIEDTSALVAKARADAVKDALAQGRQLASAASVKLGAIRTIDDTGTALPQPEYFQNAASGAGTPPNVPVEAGQQQLSVDVTVVFDIAS